MRLHRQLGGFRHIFTHREKLTVIYSDSSYLPSPPILSVSVNRPYFNLRGLPWRGEKEAIRYWQSCDAGYMDLFMRCYWERRRAERVRLYAELVRATIEPVDFQWDADGPNFVVSPPKDMTCENLERAQRFWRSLLSG